MEIRSFTIQKKILILIFKLSISTAAAQDLLHWKETIISYSQLPLLIGWCQISHLLLPAENQS